MHHIIWCHNRLTWQSDEAIFRGKQTALIAMELTHTNTNTLSVLPVVISPYIAWVSVIYGGKLFLVFWRGAWRYIWYGDTGGMEIQPAWRYTTTPELTIPTLDTHTIDIQYSLSFHQYNPHIVCFNTCLMHIVNAVYPPAPSGRTGARCVNINRNRPQVIFRFTTNWYSLVPDQDSHNMNTISAIGIPATATPQ
jgi:hypothetical protein